MLACGPPGSSSLSPLGVDARSVSQQPSGTGQWSSGTGQWSSGTGQWSSGTHLAVREPEPGGGRTGTREDHGKDSRQRRERPRRGQGRRKKPDSGDLLVVARCRGSFWSDGFPALQNLYRDRVSSAGSRRRASGGRPIRVADRQGASIALVWFGFSGVLEAGSAKWGGGPPPPRGAQRREKR